MKIYYASISEFFDEDQAVINAFYDKALTLVTSSRREKVEKRKVLEDKLRTLLAGLLLNYATGMWEKESAHNTSGAESIKKMSLADLLNQYDSCYDYEIVVGENGKPMFKDRQIHFNLSHSGNYAVCAVSSNPIGVDIEGNRNYTASIVDRYFMDKEKQWIKEDADKRDERFFRVWTFKEAYGKATGKGVPSILETVDYIDNINNDSLSVYETSIDGYRLCCIEFININYLLNATV